MSLPKIVAGAILAGTSLTQVMARTPPTVPVPRLTSPATPAEAPYQAPPAPPAQSPSQSAPAPEAQTPQQTPIAPPAQTPQQTPAAPPAQTPAQTSTAPSAMTPAQSTPAPPSQTPAQTTPPPLQTPTQTAAPLQPPAAVPAPVRPAPAAPVQTPAQTTPAQTAPAPTPQYRPAPAQPPQPAAPAPAPQYRPAVPAAQPVAQPTAPAAPQLPPASTVIRQPGTAPAPGSAAAPAPAPAPATASAPSGVAPAILRPPVAAHALPIPAAPVTPESRADDDTFLLLREASRQDDAGKANAYASRLANYAIPGYVDYYRLKTRMRVATPDEFRDFLNRYQGSAIADRLRNDWLLELGRARDWANFDQQLPLFVLNDDTQVKCYALLSRVTKGERVADDARALLTSPAGYGDACNGLITALAQAGQFDTNDLLAQLRLSGEANATGPARRVAALLGASDLRAAQAVDFPALAMARGIGDTRAEHEIYLVAVSRMARTSQKLAVIALNKNAARLTPQEQAIGWAGIAHAASLTLAPEAADYWRKSAGAPLSQEQAQWKTRIAMRRADWKSVKATIDAMPPQLRSQPTWTYWLGRALQAELGQHEQAAALYQRIADQTNFYGQLALEELGQKISIPPPGPAITAEELAPMAANPGLRRALKFFSLRLRFEGTREWNWELRKFSERELLAAAEFARRHEILDRMVNTSDRTRTQFDYTQRFPAPHHDILAPTARELGLDRAWVYGLIRQESRFIMDAQSSVGAAGLMQVMPSTGAYVARKIGLGDYVKNKLTDLRTNLVLGANYMNMVLANADGSQTLATAAYNAGPGRMRNWRSTLTDPMEGAIFAESIPYNETRTYVKNVMANATNYAALFENKPQSLKARLGKVSPRSAQGGDLP